MGWPATPRSTSRLSDAYAAARVQPGPRLMAANGGLLKYVYGVVGSASTVTR